MPKIIFLDVDGVLCTLRSHLAYHGRGGLWNHWDGCAVEILKRMCGAGCRIVVSSTWRLNCPTPDDDSSELGQKLGEHGLREFLFRPGWRTPSSDKERGHEIAAWLKAHPEITDYVILDDDDDMLPEQKSKFVQTHGHDGISGMDMLHLLKWAEVKDEGVAV